MIYWTPHTGAHPVSGSILATWAAEGYKKGPHGYPVEDPVQDRKIKNKQQFENGALSGYSRTIEELGENIGISGEELDKTVELLIEDFEKHHIDVETGFADLLKRAQESLAFNQSQLNTPNSTRTRSVDEADGCHWVPPGSTSTVRGDVFYSIATTYTINHGHNGIFLDGGKPAKKLSTVEAVNPAKGVRVMHGWSQIGVCKPKLLHVNTDEATRDAAARFAEHQKLKDYNRNFLTTRLGPYEKDSYNCAELVWKTYKYASGGGLDIGERYPYEPYSAAVFTSDILRSHNTTLYR